jgi:hypothetical protein
MALTNAEKQKRWRDKRNALAKQALEQSKGSPTPSLSMSAQQKLESAVRQHKRKLDLEFEQRVLDECRKRIEETILPSYNREKAIYEDLIKARKGLMDRATYKKILACLHPDGSMSKERVAEAFHLFSQLEKRLLDEKESPTPTMTMPQTYEELMEWKRRASEARKAKRARAVRHA